MKICGTDEAGRGPVIGPMVMCAVNIDDKDEDKLINLGVKDSKLIPPKKREELFDKIIAIVDDYEIIILSPAQIDSALNDPHLNLNWLEAVTTAKILNNLKPDKVFVDCPSTNIQAYHDYLENLLEHKMQLVVEHKADVNYPVAAAASILAKVTRDREIEKLKLKYGNCGSGYPSDPTTKKFLAENWEKYPEIFRQTWASYKKIAIKKSQKGLQEF